MQDKLKKEILEELRHKVQMYFYNAEYPEAYSDEEIQKYEKKVDNMMEIFNHTIDRVRKEVIEDLWGGIRRFGKMSYNQAIEDVLPFLAQKDKE